MAAGAKPYEVSPVLLPYEWPKEKVEAYEKRLQMGKKKTLHYILPRSTSRRTGLGLFISFAGLIDYNVAPMETNDQIGAKESTK